MTADDRDFFQGDAVAAAWERNRDQIFESSRPVSEWMVERLDPQPGQRILELTAGPGETGFLVAERIGPDGSLLSTDLAPGMVDAARRGAAARGLTNVECRVMDAQQVDLPDDSVDGALSRFGVMLVPEPARAVAEARRVVRPGGRFVYVVWGPPDRNPWLTLLAMTVVGQGHTIEGDPFGPGGPFSLAAPEANRDLLAGAGFGDVAVEEITGAMSFPSVEAYWELQSQLGGPIAALVASLSDDQRTAIVAALAESVAPFRVDGGLALPWVAVGATGVA